jgi:hypothetical protein
VFNQTKTFFSKLLTENLINSARHDIVKILKALIQSDTDYAAVVLNGSFPLTDKFGNSKETNVDNVVYKRETVRRINWEKFDDNNVYDIADENWAYGICK